METINNWKEIGLNSFNKLGLGIADSIGNIVGALLILLLGWITIKIVTYLLKRILKFAKVDRLTDLINEKDLFGKTDLKFNVSGIIIAFVKWILLLVFLIAATDVLQWEVVSNEIGNLMRYLPKLFSGIALFMIGLYVANFVRKAIKGLFESFDLSGAKIISSVVFYIIAMLITVTALNQAGIQTEIITNNLTIILGAFLASVALAFGLGSKEVVGNLMKSFYTRRNFEVGQKIHFKDIDGTIESIDNITMTLKTTKGKLILPIKDVVENQIEIEETP